MSSPQLSRILADLEKHKHCFDLDRDGLGQQIAEAAAVGIFEAMDAETGPDGAWAPLSETYAAWKAQKYGSLKMAELTLGMKAPDQILGEVEITAHAMTQAYGLDAENRQKAAWFSEGNDNQPARPFYALNGLSLRAIAEVLDRRFAEVVR